MFLDDTLHECKPEPGAFGARRDESLEGPLFHAVRHTGSPIGHFDLPPVLGLTETDLDRGVPWTGFDSVAHDVDQDAAHRVRVALDSSVAPYVDLDPLYRRLLREQCRDVAS